MAVKVLLRKSTLVLAVCVFFVMSLALSVLRRSNRDHASLEVLAKCQEVHRFLEMKDLLRGEIYKMLRNKKAIHITEKQTLQSEDGGILEHLRLMQRCPWKPDPTALARYRAELGLCCNASFQLLVTKENAPLGSELVSDVNKNWKQPVKAELVDFLPERSPFSDTRYRRCAVVGNGGILLNSNCGQEIDQADLIVRFNMPPMNFSEDVGTQTSLVTINPSILETKYMSLKAQRKPFADAVRLYRGSFFLIPAFSFRGHAEEAYRALHTVRDFGLEGQVIFINPHYLNTLSSYWNNLDLNPQRLSSGFMFVSVALELCQHITLYGFWPFPYDLDRQPIPHHYYDNVLPKPGVHAMPGEFLHYLSMYAQGVLRLRLDKCQ